MTKTEIEERKAKRKAYFQKMKEKYEKIDLHQMHSFAKKVAEQQTHKEIDKYPDGEPEFSVGFAWVNVYGLRKNSKLVKKFEEIGFKWNEYKKCLGMSSYKILDYNGQCIMVKEAGVHAYADVCKNYGLDIYAESRLD